MAKQLTDDESNIRRRARRRLIGAIALMLAAVVILPMVLDNEPKSAEPDIDLRIPDPDNSGEFVSSVTIPEESTLPPPSEQPIVTETAKTPTASGNEADSGRKPEDTSQSKPQTIAKAVNKTRIPDKPVAALIDGYVAQTGAYSNANTAKLELDKIKKWGFKAYTEKVGDVIRVRVGPYPTREKAEKAGKMLEKHGIHPVILSAK